MVSNVIVLVTTLTTMLLLEWRLTILTLVVLPLFILPARRVGRRLANIAREQMNLNSRLNTQMTERFNVAGATLVKLFGQADEEHREFAQRASKVRDIGIRSAMYGRVFFVALGIVAAVGAAMIYGVGGQQVISGTIQVGTLVAMASYAGRIYQPLTGLTNARVDIMSCARQLRAGLRGPRRPRGHRRQAVGDRSAYADRAHRVRPRVVPLSRRPTTSPSPRSPCPAPRDRTRTGWCCRTSTWSWSPASWWPSSGHRAPARPPWPR